MCQFCTDGEHATKREKGARADVCITWESGFWCIRFELENISASINATMNIAYCPICGRRLEGGSDDHR